MKTDTKCVQSGYLPENGQPRVAPINMSTTFKYDSADKVGELFDLKSDGFFYTRLANPTAAAAEGKIADLEGGSGAMMTSAGQSATLITVLNLASAGDRIICGTSVYGGTFNLLDVTLRRLGIQTDFVDLNDLKALEAAVKPETKAVLGETLANPALTVLDIEEVSRICKKAGIPLIVDNTFATPILCRPLDYGADIVLHSSSKYLDGHAVALGGMIVDGGKFDFTNGKFPGFTQPDESYHGVRYCESFGSSAFIVKARVQLMRDLGCAPSPMNAFLTNLGMETLHLRMPRHCENASAVAKFLQSDVRVKSVKYPGLTSDADNRRAEKYLGGSGGGVISFELASKEQGVKFMDSLKLIKIAVHVADVRSCLLHPASSTHRQMNDAQLAACGISPGLIRLSVGIEDVGDLIADIDQALNK